MTVKDAENIILARCEVIYNGITYARAVAYERWYDCRDKKWHMSLILQDCRNQNSIMRAVPERCTVIPL